MAQYTPEQARNLIKKLIHINKTHRTAVEALANSYGIHRSQHMTLSYLAKNEGRDISQSDIARAFEISPSAVAVTLKKLEGGGFVERVVNDGDNRYNRIAVTHKGKEALKCIQSMFDGVDSAMLSEITKEEYKVLEKAFDKMLTGLKGIE